MNVMSDNRAISDTTINVIRSLVTCYANTREDNNNYLQNDCETCSFNQIQKWSCQRELIRNACRELEAAVERISTMQERMVALEKRNEPMLMTNISETIAELEVGICPACNKSLLNDLRRPTKYCKYCGQAVKWPE
ncbi:MAG: hypothetical protein IJT99_01275 [Clostridia bacterium]|nr:hypothetical protein [Clostridia bacterium]